MNTPAEFNPQPYLVEVDPARPPENFICGDDRPNVEGIIGWQMFGGPDGLGRDAAMALEIQKPGSFTEQGIPKHHLGALLARRLSLGGTFSYMHHGCASFLEAVSVNDMIADDPDQVYQQVRRLGVDVSGIEMEQAVDASWRLRESGLLIPPRDIHDELLEGRDDSPIKPVPHLHLVDVDHVAQDVVVSHTPEVEWHSQAAFEDNSPAYAIGFGTLEAQTERIRTIIPVDPRALMVAAYARAASVTLLLPTPDGKPLQLHPIGEPRAA